MCLQSESKIINFTNCYLTSTQPLLGCFCYSLPIDFKKGKNYGLLAKADFFRV